MEFEFLKALVLVFGVSALSVLLLHRLKIPPLIGFIATGALMGPYGMGIVHDVRNIEILADIGVILLLFTVGVEFSIGKLFKMRRAVMLGGGGQVALTILFSAAVTYPFIKNISSAVFFGFLIALSSTAIVLKILFERGEIDSPAGRLMVGILILQDLCVVPLMLLTPALSGGAINAAQLAATFIKALIIIAAVLLSAKWIVPRAFHQILRTRSRELFTISVIFICLGIALLTSRFGLSLALGAFLAGLVISESEYALAATAEIVPFKDSFLGMFFVSVGMLVDLRYVAENWPAIAVAIVVIFAIKALITTGLLHLMGTPFKASAHAGLGLAQIGEFSFVLAAVGKKTGVISEATLQLFLSASVATMAITPFVLRSAPALSSWLASRGKPGKIKEEIIHVVKKSGHVIIVGFGLNGRNLARTLAESGLPYVILDLNSETVREQKRKGQPIYFGDGSSTEILDKLGIHTARVLVVAISDPASARKIVSVARKENPALHIIVRTRYQAEVEDLAALGANEVIPEEFETSVEIFSRVLHHYNVPKNLITDHINHIRKNSYKALRTYELPQKPFREGLPLLSEIEIETYLIKKGSNLAGHTIRELDVRARTGATVMAVQRDEDVHQNPEPAFSLLEGDVILLVGKREDMDRALDYMESDRLLTIKYHS